MGAPWDHPARLMPPWVCLIEKAHEVSKTKPGTMWQVSVKKLLIQKFLLSAYYMPSFVSGTEHKMKKQNKMKQKFLHFFKLKSFLHVIFYYLTLRVGASHFVLVILVISKINHFT